MRELDVEQQRKRDRRRPGLPAWHGQVAVVAAAILGTGGIAFARATIVDHTDDEFQRLHPDKSNINSTSVEPHALAGTITLPDGAQVRLYVTTAAGDKSCADVQQLGRDGTPLGSVGFCSNDTTESLRQVNGGLVGYVPDDAVSNVRVTGPAGTVDTPVSHRHFLLDPTIGPPGSTIEIVEYAGTRTLRTVPVTVAGN